MDITYVDVFVGPGFLGNPAAVMLVDGFPPDMAAIARRNGFPATVFVRGTEIRWFTPSESELCGHGTLAATHVLLERHGGDVVMFQSRSGPLTATREGEGIAVDLPAFSVVPTATPNVHDANGRLLMELESEAAVRAMGQELAGGEKSVIVTARAAAPYDFVSRYFRKEGDEDAVTGSAHCALAPYWSQRLGKSEMRAYQASARGGELRVKHTGDRVTVIGRVVSRDRPTSG